MYFGCCIYVLLLLNMPEMAHDWINKCILFYIQCLCVSGSCQREPALKLTAMLIDVCGVQCVLPPAVTDSKLFLLITHLCCVEVRMVLEDSDIKLVSV